jgi:hypothetical protein
MWVITDWKILANRSDIVLHDKIEKNCLLIDVAMPHDSNINIKETEKLSKYKVLGIEFSRMLKMRTEIVQVIFGSLGTNKKWLDQNLQLLPGHSSATELQFTLKSTAHIIRKVLG